MIRPKTLALASVLTVTCLGGKALAALSSRWMFGFTGPDSGMVFALSSPQAAATLAATIVPHQIGLFNDTVVNAVLVLIVVSLVVASLAAVVSGRMVPRPSVGADRLGRTVVLALGDEEDSLPAARVAARLAETDGGVVVAARVQVPAPARHDTRLSVQGAGGFDAVESVLLQMARGDAGVLIGRR